MQKAFPIATLTNGQTDMGNRIDILRPMGIGVIFASVEFRSIVSRCLPTSRIFTRLSRNGLSPRRNLQYKLSIIAMLSRKDLIWVLWFSKFGFCSIKGVKHRHVLLTDMSRPIILRSPPTVSSLFEIIQFRTIEI